MRNTVSQLPPNEPNYVLFNFEKTKTHVKQYWFRLFALAILAFIFVKKDFTFELNLNSKDPLTISSKSPNKEADVQPVSLGQLPLASSLLSIVQEEKPSENSLKELHEEKIEAASVLPHRPKPSKAEMISLFEDNTSNTYSNMTYHKKVEHVAKGSKLSKQKAYVKRFSSVAKSEMKKFGIPASITLAQGLIESNAGESKLAQQNNNHFGMKCFSKKCSKGHCSNFTDDSHKDFFRKYKSAWESYRSHSNMLMGKRYKNLRKHGKDYKAWAYGLKKAGYATDKRYAQKLIHIIEELKLYQYDK